MASRAQPAGRPATRAAARRRAARLRAERWRRFEAGEDLRDPVAAAASAGLRYASDDGPGIVRRRSGRGFRYELPDGSRVTDRATLERIRTLVIPPAWTDVWIARSSRAHLQATGRDARGRKQYRYHPRWHEVRDETKFGRMAEFGRRLPELRGRVQADLRLRRLARERVLAAVVALLDETLARVGNHEYARDNQTYGLTTLEADHAEVAGDRLRLSFRGKGGKEHELEVRNPRVIRVVRRCQDLPGQRLFGYLDDDGVPAAIDAGDVNAYLREVTGETFTAKDFRTWGATVAALRELAAMPAPTSPTAATRNVAAAVRAVAGLLGNTPAVCRRSYVHPAVIEAYVGAQGLPPLEVSAGSGLRPDEEAVMALLHAHEAADQVEMLSAG